VARSSVRRRGPGSWSRKVAFPAPKHLLNGSQSWPCDKLDDSRDQLSSSALLRSWPSGSQMSDVADSAEPWPERQRCMQAEGELATGRIETR